MEMRAIVGHGDLAALGHAVVVGDGALEGLAQQVEVFFAEHLGGGGQVLEREMQAPLQLLHGQPHHHRRIAGHGLGLEVIELLDDGIYRLEDRDAEQVVGTLGVGGFHAQEGAIARCTVGKVYDRGAPML